MRGSGSDSEDVCCLVIFTKGFVSSGHSLQYSSHHIILLSSNKPCSQPNSAADLESDGVNSPYFLGFPIGMAGFPPGLCWYKGLSKGVKGIN
ncbi:hypothetical protein ABKN59_007965 [Abortiporus biennis]